MAKATKQVAVEQSDDRRAAIIRAAARMFQERGYSGTTVRDLAHAVGITSGSIFHHFGTKEEVLLAVVDHGLDEATVGFAAETIREADPPERLRGMVRAHLTALLGGAPETLSVLFHERWMLSNEARAKLIDMRDAYEAIWDAALADLGAPYDDAPYRTLSRLLLLGSMNWTAQWYRPDGEFDIDEIAEAVAARYLP